MLDVEFMHAVLWDAQEIYIAMNAEGAPYVLPVNHVFHGGCIYFHCATEGHKLDLLRSDPRVGFSTAVDVVVDGTTTRYRSVCGTGVAEIVTDNAELKSEILQAIAARFNAPCHFPVSQEQFAATGMVRIHIESMTGKYSRRGEGKRPVPHGER
jgi:nitroimidazol reductase NimA-like FMN-containing flavoprotein (pyridoxamine 5'-phosphate oxidase superfamily)